MPTIHELKRAIAEKMRAKADAEARAERLRKEADEQAAMAGEVYREALELSRQLPPILDRGRAVVGSHYGRFSGHVKIEEGVLRSDAINFLNEAMPEGRNSDWFKLDERYLCVNVGKPAGLYGAGTPGGAALTETIKLKTQALRDKLKEILRDNGYKVR